MHFVSPFEEPLASVTATLVNDAFAGGVVASQLIALQNLAAEAVVSFYKFAVAIHHLIFPTAGVISLLCLLSQVIRVVHIKHQRIIYCPPTVKLKKFVYKIDQRTDSEPIKLLGAPMYNDNTTDRAREVTARFDKAELKRSAKAVDWTLLENVLHVFCLLLAVTLSVSAIESEDQGNMRHWLIFWMLYLALGAAESLQPAEWMEQPVYLLGRLALVTWLACCGSDMVYCILKGVLANDTSK